MLIDQNETILVLERDVRSAKLKELRDFLYRLRFALIGVFVRCEQSSMIHRRSGKRHHAVGCRSVALIRYEGRIEIPRADRGGSVECSERSPYCCLDRTLDRPSFEKANFGLCRVHVDIDARHGKSDAQKK